MSKYALVIGIQKYGGSGFSDLENPVEDAETIARLLEQHGDFVEVKRLPARWNEEQQSYEVTETPLLSTDLDQAITEFFEQVGSNEALIYFSGHGAQVTKMGRKKGYLVTSDCTANTVEAAGIALTDLNSLILEASFSSLVVLLDCCHAGGLLEKSQIAGALTAFNAGGRNYFLATACRSYEKAYEGKEHSLFTSAVIKALQSPGADGRVRTARLNHVIDEEMRGSGQEPVILRSGSEITLVTYTANGRKGSDIFEEAPGISQSDVHLRKSYLQWLISCHERLEFRGVRYARGGTVSVELKQVYLALQADLGNPLERAAARQLLLAEVETAIQNGEIPEANLEHVEWLFIAGSPITSSIESRNWLNEIDPKSKKLLNLGEAYFQESQLVILGDPGSGKTTLARWLSLVSAQAALQGRRELVVPISQVDPIVDDEDPDQSISLGLTRLPIILRISEYAEERQRQAEIGNAPPTLLEFLGRQTWLGHVPVWEADDPKGGNRIEPKILNQLFRKALQSGEALVVLDGLDEVPASALRDEIVEEVDLFNEQWIRRQHLIQQIQTFGNEARVFITTATADIPGNRLLVTSRIAGYHAAPLRGNLAHVTVEPMSSNAVARFIRNWMRAVHQELVLTHVDAQTIQAESGDESERFLAVLNEPRQRGGRELATNPLLCGILATIFHQRDGKLPQERVELYHQAVELLLDVWIRRQRDDDDAKLLRYELFDVLEPLAEHIHRYEPTGLIPELQLRQLTLQFLALSRGENPLRPTPQLRKTVDEIIRVIREDVGLIAARGEGVYGFLHLTFQEYLAARALVGDPVLACSQITDRMGDARWREAIRLGLGYLSAEHPRQLAALMEQLLTQQTPLQDLLPQAALTIVGSLPDLCEIHPTLIGELTEHFVAAYATQDLLDRLPRRRDLLEWAVKELMEFSAHAVEDVFIEFLENAPQSDEQAAAIAQLMCQLDFFTPKLFVRLLQASAYDLSNWNYPIHAALRIAMTPRHGEGSSRVQPPHGTLPFRQFLLQEPEIARYVCCDFDWLRLAFALFGGVGDYRTRNGVQTYYEMSAFLQQKDAARDRYRLAYVDKWSGDDFVYNMAVFLDLKGGSLTRGEKIKLSFNPQDVCRNSQWNSEIYSNLRKKTSAQDLLGSLKINAKKSSVDAALELDLIQWILQGNTTDTSSNPLNNDKLLNYFSVLQQDLSDAVIRTKPRLALAFPSIIKMIKPGQFWCLVEALSHTIFCRGGTPLISELLPLKSQSLSLLDPYILAEALALYCQGWGDDAIYSTAIFLDTTKTSARELLSAYSVLPLSSHLDAPLTYWEWSISCLPTAGIPENDIPPAILNNLLMIPLELGFMREWSLNSILGSVIKGNSELLPEILAFALGDGGYRGSRIQLFDAYAPELLNHPNPEIEIYQRTQSLKHPYYRVRGLLRLAQSWPKQRDQLLVEAENVATQVNDPLQGTQIYEWLAALSLNKKQKQFFQKAVNHVEKINDYDEQSRAWGRLGILAPSEQQVVECFKYALESVAKITDEFTRGTTIRLLRKVVGVAPELSYQFKELLSEFKDPILKSRAAEEWGSVFRHLSQYLRGDSENLEVWAILSLAAQADQAVCQDGQDYHKLWIRLGEAPSIEIANQIYNLSDNGILKFTPLVVQCLNQLIAKDEFSIIELLYPRLRVSLAEVIPFLRRQLYSPSELISSVSSILLAERQGLSKDVIPGIIKCLTLKDDLSRHRASDILYGSPSEEANYRASLIGQAGLDNLFALPSTCSIGNIINWFCERLMCDSAEQIAEWARRLQQNPACNASKRGLSSLHHIEENVWEQLLIELEHKDGNVQEAILKSMARLAKHDRLKDGKGEALTALMVTIDHSDLETRECLSCELVNFCAVLIEVLRSNPDEPINTALATKVRQKFKSEHVFSWARICQITNSTEQLDRLKAIGETFYTKNSTELERWKESVSTAQPSMEHSGFLELLCEWSVLALTENITDPERASIESSYLLELFAGAVSLAPSRFLQCSSSTQLRSLLVVAVRTHTSFTGRSGAVRLLGYLRHLTLDILPALRSALGDVEFVREGAIEAMGLFRQMDSNVLNEMENWLTDESGLVAYATARLLTAIGRHAQTTGRLERHRSASMLRQEIVEILAKAVRDPRSSRRLDFGSGNFPAPIVPRLCDFFYDCMLKVSGYDDGKCL
jgi:Caspase domain/NACHT domain